VRTQGLQKRYGRNELIIHRKNLISCYALKTRKILLIPQRPYKTFSFPDSIKGEEKVHIVKNINPKYVTDVVNAE
jgi:hypothetical protein